MLDVTGLVVAPGFVDPHGHSDGTLFIDGALASHLHQGYTTQLSGNCGYTYAPLDARSLPGLAPDLRGAGPRPGLGLVRRLPRRGGPGRARPERRVPRRPRDGPRVGARAGRPCAGRRRARRDGPPRGRGARGRGGRRLDGPHLRAGDARLDPRRSRRSSRPRTAGTRSMPPTCATSRTACTGRSTRRSRPRAARATRPGDRAGSRCRTSRPARRPSGARERPSSSGSSAPVPPASTSRRTSTPTRQPRRPSPRCSRRRSSPSPPRMRRPRSASPRRAPGSARPRRRASRLGERGRRPGLGRHRHRRSTARPEWSGRSLATIADDLGGDPFELALDVLAEDRLNTTSCSTAWRSPTSRRSCACPGSRSAPTRPAAGRATRSSTTASRTRAATARRRASSAATGATGACSRSRPRSRS